MNCWYLALHASEQKLLFTMHCRHAGFEHCWQRMSHLTVGCLLQVSMATCAPFGGSLVGPPRSCEVPGGPRDASRAPPGADERLRVVLDLPRDVDARSSLDALEPG